MCIVHMVCTTTTTKKKKKKKKKNKKKSKGRKHKYTNFRKYLNYTMLPTDILEIGIYILFYDTRKALNHLFNDSLLHIRIKRQMLIRRKQ